MRSIVFIFSAFLIASTLGAASWKEYPQPQLGFVVEFPAEPVASIGKYSTVLVPAATAHVFTVKEEHTLYTATAVDLLDRKEDGAILLAEAHSYLSNLGDVTSVSTSRVEPGRAAVYGYFITMNCRTARVPDEFGRTAEAVRTWYKNFTGSECPDGSRLMANIFFHRGRLYMIQGMNLSSTTEATSSPSALRFADSVSFFAADGTRNVADTAQ